MRIDHSIEIAAPVDRVWAATIDVESLPTITPTMTRVERLDDGPMRVGSTARIEQPGQRARTWTVTDVEPRRRFAWDTSAPGVRMTAVHELTPTAHGTRNTLSLEVTGPVGKLVGPLIRGRVAKAIATENDGFKRHAESQNASPGR